ncbi:MAG: DNA polymerase III subunit delta [Bacteroidales bacterium]|nr:DNA polymerase III subunit delta [Bacteroidales bacterium]MCF8403563.1 DNA polymerase III subunit delta [Bacteroidales bacterium]
MNHDQILNDLKNKIYYPWYFLSGEESYYIDMISDYIEDNVLSDTEKEFNQTIIYGRDTDVKSLVSVVKRFPMMANHQVVIVKEAQDIDKIEELLPYIENPLTSTILVLNYKYKKVDKRKAFFKTIAKKGILFESKKIYDNQVAPWINKYIVNKGYSITPKAAAILGEYLGADLGKVVNEISKLIINLPEGAEINELLVEQNIGISKDYNIFELQNAIGSRNIEKANRIVNYFAANPKENPLIKTVSLLFSFFAKILIYHQLKDKSRNSVASALGVSPFFVTDYQLAARNYNVNKVARLISYLRDYDLKSKGVNNISTSDGELLKELMFKILH